MKYKRMTKKEIEEWIRSTDPKRPLYLENMKKTLEKKEKLAGRRKPESCEICGGMGAIHFDHNHKTNRFRGWICRRCNMTLGMVKDDFELLRKLAEYLINNQ